MKRLTRFLIVCMVWFSVPAYALDSYTDDMTTTTGWTDADAGTTAAWTQTTFDGRSCFKFTVPTAGTGNVSMAYRVLPVSGGILSIKMATYFDSIGTSAASNFFSFTFSGRSATANMTTVYFASDGLYSSGTDSESRSEIGTDLVDQDVWTHWEFRVTAPTPATATMAVYKDGVQVATGVDVSRLDGGTLYNRFTFSQYGYTLNNATTYVDSIDVKSWGLNYFDNCDDITDWDDSDEGNGVSSEDSGTYKFTATSASNTTLGGRSKKTFLFPAKFSIETKINHESLGTIANFDYFRLYFSDTTGKYNVIAFASDGLFRRAGSATYTEIGTDLVDVGVDTTWKFDVDTVANTMNVTKNGIRVATSVSIYYYTASATGGVFAIFQYCYSHVKTTRMKYLRIYSEDGQLIQTIVE